MKTSFFVGVAKVFIAVLTLFTTTCCGMPLQTVVEDNEIHSRPSRSVHALHARLCPEGTNTKNCFYSQLSMYMQMHEPLRDLSSSRVIGKRSMSSLSLDAPSEVLSKGRVNSHDAIELLRELLEDNPGDNEFIFDPNADDKVSNLNNDILDIGTDTDDNDILIYLTNFGADSEALNQYVDERMKDILTKDLQRNDLLEKRLDDINGYSDLETPYMPVNKRQIVCPPGKARLNCYNNAFAYYMQLLKTVGDH